MNPRAGALVLLCCLPAAARGHRHRRVDGPACGVERWAVKTLSDPDARSVVPGARRVSVEDLLRLPAPPYDAHGGRRGAELQTFTLEAELVSFKLEQDGDLHAVLEGSTGARLVVEFPTRDCLPDSPHAAQIAQAREAFERAAGPVEPRRSHRLRRPRRIRVSGVGYFDSVHGQSGGAANGFELHPVLDVGFP